MGSIEIGVWAFLGTLVALAIKGLVDVAGNQMAKCQRHSDPQPDLAPVFEDATSRQLWMERLVLYKRYSFCAHALAEDLRSGRSHSENRKRLTQLYDILVVDGLPGISVPAQEMRLACVKMIFQGANKNFESEFRDASHAFQLACNLAEKSPPLRSVRQLPNDGVPAMENSDASLPGLLD